MAVSIPIISEFNSQGVKKAIAEFKQLETKGQKAGFLLKKAMLPATAAIGALAAGALKAVNAASDLAEAQSKVNVIFGDGAMAITEFSKTAAKQIGQSRQSVMDAAGTFGTFGKAAGLSGTQLSDFAIKFTKLASDIASFSNATPEEVITSLGAGLRGEAEPLRRFGVLLSQEAIELEAVNMGLVKFTKNSALVKRATVAVEKAQYKYTQAVARFGPDSIQAREAMAAYEVAQDRLSKQMAGKMDKLTQEQKILAATSLIYKQTGDAQGDFERTGSGLANQQRKLTAEFENLKTTLGQALLPVMEELMPHLTSFAQWASENPGTVKMMAAAIMILAGSIIAVNVAMMANPISLLIAGLVLLGLGVVTAYQKFEKFRNVVNGVFNGVAATIEWIVNFWIDSFNRIITGINLISPFKDIPKIPGLKLPRLGNDQDSSGGIKVPAMADGGLVTQPTLALIGEAGPEMVVPLSKMGNMGDHQVNIYVNGGDPQAVVDALRRYYRQNGPIPVAVSF